MIPEFIESQDAEEAPPAYWFTGLLGALGTVMIFGLLIIVYQAINGNPNAQEAIVITGFALGAILFMTIGLYLYGRALERLEITIRELW